MDSGLSKSSSKVAYNLFISRFNSSNRILLLYTRIPLLTLLKPFYAAWYNDCSSCEYLIHTIDSEHFTYHNYYTNTFKPLLHRLHIDRTPHCCRHTTISVLTDAHVDQTIIKKIVGHSGAMTLTERVYTHLDIHELISAINQI